MKTAVLFSGGKDSTYSMYLASKDHKIKYLVTIFSKNPDSYMFHTSNIELTKKQAECLNIELISKEIEGEKEVEVEELKELLKGLDIEGLVCGGIESKYQKSRLEKICNDLGLKLISPLWKIDKEKYLRDLVKDFEVIITSISADGFDETWLGRKIDEKCIEDLLKLNKNYGISIVGEGGEFCTMVLDCPMFKKKIEVINSEKIWKENCGKFIINKDIFVQKN